MGRLTCNQLFQGSERVFRADDNQHVVGLNLGIW
jgi:hypothetical protein